MLSLPSTVLVNRTMPKKAFRGHLKATADVKAQFVRDIERIEMVASIKEESVHVPAGTDVDEIDVLGLHLRRDDGRSEVAVPHEAIEAIVRVIPRKLVFACLDDNLCKLLVRRDRLYETDWRCLDDARLELCGADLDEVWDSLCSQVVFGTSDPRDFTVRLQRTRRRAALRAELERLQKKRANERQVARRNELWNRLKTIEAEIDELNSLDSQEVGA